MKKENNKSDAYLIHNNSAHDDKLRTINKGDFTTVNNFAQTTFDKDDKSTEKHKSQNLNLDKEKNYSIENKSTNEPAEKLINPTKNEDFLNDETLANKSEKDYERVPDEHERINKKVNKRLNKAEEKHQLKHRQPVSDKQEDILSMKTEALISDSLNEMITKF